MSTPPSLDESLRNEFRRGFFRYRLAQWVEDPIVQQGSVEADIAGCLAAIEAGKRDFAYPGHDAAVFKVLESLIPERRLRRGADIGCATGCFPAMQLHSGIDSCTVFEVRETTANDDRVEIRIEDLTYSDDLEPEFDLITCLSTIEHVGLGRYGDPIDPLGDIKMAANLRLLLRPGGFLLLSFPVGPGCVVFNQHRIYTRLRCRSLFGDLTLVRTVHDRSLLRRVRMRVRRAYMQPIFVLQA